MPELRVGEATYVVDEHGFLQEPERWDDAVAAALAAGDGVNELTDDHWKVVRYIRAHYLEFGVPPLIRKLCKQTRFKLKEIYDLFPTGPAKGACMVAGLPDGKGCV